MQKIRHPCVHHVGTSACSTMTQSLHASLTGPEGCQRHGVIIVARTLHKLDRLRALHEAGRPESMQERA